MSGDKCYSRDGETYTEDFEAVLDDFDEYGDLEVGAVYYEADKVQHKAGHYVRVLWIDILKHIIERAWDEAYELSANFGNDVAPAKWVELETLIKGWLDANVPVNFWTVANARECQITAADIAGYMDEAVDTSPERVESEAENRHDDPLTRHMRLSEEIGGLYDDDASGAQPTEKDQPKEQR